VANAAVTFTNKGRLNIELASTLPDASGIFRVTARGAPGGGTLTLAPGAVLNVSLYGGFRAPPGEHTWRIVECGALNGACSVTNLPVSGDATVWTTTAGTNYIDVTSKRVSGAVVRVL
jgi:hypothetical protein